MDESEYQEYLNQINSFEQCDRYDYLLEALANDEQIVPGCYWVRPAPVEQ